MDGSDISLRDDRRPSDLHDPDELLWRQFGEAKSAEAFARTWLALQCRMIPGVTSGVPVLRRGGAADPGPPPPRGRRRPAAPALRRRAPDRGGRRAPGRGGGRRVAPQRARRRRDGPPARVGRRLARDRPAARRPHARAFAPTGATRLDADRVTLGFLRRGRARAVAVSHSAKFSRSSNLVRAIEQAMDEAIDQRALVVWPQPSDWRPQVARAHAELARQHAVGNVCTVPLVEGGRVL